MKTKRIPVGIDPVYLAHCKALDDAQNKTDAAYVLEVYLEGQARRRQRSGSQVNVEAVYED